MRDRDLLLLGFVGIGAYALYKNETNKITSVIDSISVPLTDTSNTINKSIDNFNSIYNSITKTLTEYITPKPPPPPTNTEIKKMLYQRSIITALPVPHLFKDIFNLIKIWCDNMKLKDLIPLGIIGALLFVPKFNNNNNVGAGTPSGAYGGVEKTRDVITTDTAGNKTSVNVPVDSNVSIVKDPLTGETKTYVYRKDGTLQAEYTKTLRWDEVDKQTKEQIAKQGGGAIKQNITYSTTDSGTKTGSYYTYVSKKDGKVKMGTEATYKSALARGDVL